MGIFGIMCNSLATINVRTHLFANGTRVSNATRRSLRAISTWGSCRTSWTRRTRWTLHSGQDVFSWGKTFTGITWIIKQSVSQTLTIWPTSPVSPFSPAGPGKPWGAYTWLTHVFSWLQTQSAVFFISLGSTHLQPNWTRRSREPSGSFISFLAKQALLASGTWLTIRTLERSPSRDTMLKHNLLSLPCSVVC